MEQRQGKRGGREGLIRFGYTDRNKGQKIRVRFDRAAKLRFLVALADTGHIEASSACAGVSSKTVRQYRAEEPEFAEAMQVAQEMFCAKLHAEAVRRGVEGVERKVFIKDGAEMGAQTLYDTRLLELLLKRHMPEFRESFKVDANVTGGVLVVPGNVSSTQDWEKEHGGGSSTD